LAGDLRLLYAQLHELETFTRFGAELEPATKHRLERGRRLREALKQPSQAPRRLGQEAAALYAIREGFLDSVSVEQVQPFLTALTRQLDEVDTAVLTALESEEALSEAVESRLREVLALVQRMIQEGNTS
jgi:F-type H+-transporting ATPase subunit alpha